jgi:hypothetical protein
VTTPLRIAATFLDARSAAAAIRALRAARCRVDAAMPVPFPEVLDALGGPPSRIGRASLGGALAGAAGGALLTAATSLAWPLATGGKAILSVPPFAIVVFELSVLLAAVATLAALVVGCLRGGAAPGLGAAAALAGDRIAVVAAGDARVAVGIVLAHGAVEVRHVA